MEIEPLGPPGLVRIAPQRFGDARGWFSESWSRARLAAHGIEADFIQDNHAFSAEAGVLRGLHLQASPAAQAKLVRCAVGRIFDVAVDVRRGSPSFGRWRGVVLDGEGGAQLFVPRGFLHGYLTLTPGCHVLYKVDGPYDPSCERAVVWDDPDLAIDWPLAEAGVAAPIHSDKDAAAPRLAAFDSPFVFEG